MKVFEIVYSIKENQTKIKAFNPFFVEEVKNKVKIIYKGKFNPIKSVFYFSEKNIKMFKIQLVTFIELPDNMFKRCDLPIKFFKKKLKNFCAKSKKAQANKIRYF